jgi:hypothetical protein
MPGISRLYERMLISKELCSIELLSFELIRSWTLSIASSLSKICPVYLSRHNVSEIGLYLRLQIKPTHLGPIDRASPYIRTPVSLPRWDLNAAHNISSARAKKDFKL